MTHTPYRIAGLDFNIFLVFSIHFSVIFLSISSKTYGVCIWSLVIDFLKL